MPTAVAWIPLDGAVNARTVIPGVLLRTDNLQDLTQADVRTLVEAHGVEVVIDLRTTGERESEGPAPLDADPRVRVEHRSLYPESGGNTDLDMSEYTAAAGVNPASLEQQKAAGAREGIPAPLVLGAVYARYLERRPDSVLAAVRAIAGTDGAVLVHCAAGKDRTGTVVAIALDAAGFPREAIVDDYVATAERIDRVMGRLVSSETYRAELEGHDPADHAPHPDTMRALLATLDERHGGAAAWLTANGLTPDELARLRARLDPPGQGAATGA